MCSQSKSRRAGFRLLNNWFCLGAFVSTFTLSILIAVWAGVSVPVPVPACEEPIVQVVEIPDDMPRGEIHVPEEYREMLSYWCNEAGVPYALMARVAQEESGWRPRANNKKGDLGMFQLHARYLEWYAMMFNDGKAIDPFDAETSTRVACRYMRYLYRQCHDYKVATMAYNCGMNRLMTEGPPLSTLKYTARVFGFEFD